MIVLISLSNPPMDYGKINAWIITRDIDFEWSALQIFKVYLNDN